MNVLENSWLALGLRLGLQLAVVIVVAVLAHRWTQSGTWRRLIWQMAFLSMIALATLEFSGLRHGLSALIGQTWRVSPMKASPGLSKATMGERAAPLGMPPGIPVLDRRPTATEVTPFHAPTIDLSADHGRALSGPGSGGWIAGLWALGTAVVVARFLFSTLALELLRRRSKKVTSGPLAESAQGLERQLGMRKGVPIYAARHLTGPVAFGVIRRGIGVPEDFSGSYAVPQQNVALAHELAHLKAWDPAWYFLADGAVALFWWHPLVWWARRHFHLACEMAADESSVLVTNGPEILADCLVELGRRHLRRGAAGGLAVAGNGFRSGLGQRVERLLQLPAGGGVVPGPLLGWGARIIWPVVVLGAVVAMTFWAEAGSQSTNTQERTMQILKRSWKQSAIALTFFATLSSASAAPLPAPPEVTLVKAAKPAPGEVGPDENSGGERPPEGRNLAAKPLPHEVRSGRESVQAKLESIIVEEASYENLPLSEVIKSLIELSTKLDSEHRGINFLLANAMDAAVAPQVDAATGLPVVQEPVDLGATSIRIVPGLKHVRMIDLLEALKRTSDRPLNYTVEDYGVVWTAGRAVLPPDLTVQTFHLNTSNYPGALKRVFGIEFNPEHAEARGAQGQQAMLRKLFQQLGIRLEAPRTAFLNAQTGVLMVRVTTSELQLVAAAVDTLGNAVEPARP